MLYCSETFFPTIFDLHSLGSKQHAPRAPERPLTNTYEGSHVKVISSDEDSEFSS